MRKQLIIAGLATAVGVTGLTSVGVVNAATSTSTSEPMSGLVQAIATKFNLNEADVKSVFEEQRTKMESEREAEIAKEVAQLVSDGKITQAQADKINAKRAELKKERATDRETMGSKTREEMKATMETKRTELEIWAKENGIDTEYLRYVMGGPGPGMHMKFRAAEPGTTEVAE